jgi:integrase
MASIQKQGAKWRVQVYADGKRDSKVLPTRQEAAQWALMREAELTGKKLPDRTLNDAMVEYGKKVSPTHRGEDWELVRLKAMGKMKLAGRKLAGLTASDFATWRDDRLKTHKPGTVAREMNLLRSVLEHARRDWGWLRVNPMEDVRWPTTPKGRARRITADEEAAIRTAFGQAGELKAETLTHRVGLAFLLALETAMRAGEMLGLQWEDVRLSERFVVLPKTKNGDRREVPLSTRAVEILRAIPGDTGSVFALPDDSRDALWRKNRPKELKSLHFHDTRSEAIWRLSKKLDVLQLARVIGHRDLKSLMIYYRESAADMAKRLD